MYKTLLSSKKYLQDKDLLTLWLNNLLVVYAFLLPISQTIKATVFSFMVILFIIRGDVVKHVKAALQNSVVRAFVYIFIAYIVGMLWTENIAEGLYWVKSIKYGLYLLLFYAIADGRYIDKVISAFIFGMFISELTSYGMHFGIMPWKLEIGRILFYQAPSMEDPSPFLNHIHYGVALAFTVILLIHKTFFEKHDGYLKIFMGIFIVTATSNIFITGGRTGYVTFFLLIVVLAVFYLRKSALGIFLAISVVFVTAYNFSPIFHAKVHQTEQSLYSLFKDDPNFNTSLGARTGIYYYAYEVIKKDPVFGVGTGDSMDKIHDMAPEKDYIINSLLHEHNQFLSVLLKLGIIGLFIYLNIFYQIYKFKQKEKDLRFIMIFITLTIAFGTLMTLFNLRFFLPLWAVFLAVTLINRDRRTINYVELDDKKQLLQIIILIAVFGGASLLHQLI
ncbi:O-antigen ligase family protein [Sulfurimonas sp. HSL-1716]|uniref:O-antigen ligase family protein n=1 Tax=Hydrocurvibacter sulfurireducens TaxID=3131937 RepID=UPI0031F8CB34